jgi:virginiamycin B lyase
VPREWHKPWALAAPAVDRLSCGMGGSRWDGFCVQCKSCVAVVLVGGSEVSRLFRLHRATTGKRGEEVGSHRAVVRNRTLVRRLALSAAALVGLPALTIGLAAGTAAASGPGKVKNYLGTSIDAPYGIAAGLNGSLWFCNFGNNSIGEISTTGTVTNYAGTGIDEPVGITAGSNGAMWFTNFGNSTIGEVTASGVVSNFTGVGISNPIGITNGPNGALWFTNQSDDSIGEITTTGSVSNYTGTGIADPYSITSGPNGALWFTNEDPSSPSIGEITTTGTVSNFTVPSISNPYGITSGPDGALWLTNMPNSADGSVNSIVRMNASGSVTNTYTSSTLDGPAAIATGSDGALWFVNDFGNSVGQITIAGKITNYTNPTMSGPIGIAAGSDGALWFANKGGSSIGRITTTVTPKIKRFTPTSGAVGQQVTITGKNLGGATRVAVDGTRAKILSDTANRIVFKVKTGSATGPVTVTTRAGTATSTGIFAVT